MPKNDNDLSASERRELFALVALAGILAKEGCAFKPASEYAVEHADRLIAVLAGDAPESTLTMHRAERIRRFKEAFFAMVNDPTLQHGHDPGISSDEILQWWRAAWEQSA